MKKSSALKSKKAYNTGIYSFPAWRSALNGQCEEQAGKFTCAVGKGTKLDSPILVR